MARRSLKPQLNQIRTWVRQGRTDSWIAHQLEVAPKDIDSFKREHELAPDEGNEAPSADPFGHQVEEEPDLRAEDDALVAAALEAEPDEPEESDDEGSDDDAQAASPQGPPRWPRASRGPRAARRSRAPSTTATRATGCGSTRPSRTTPPTPSTGPGTVRSTVTVEQDQIVIRRAGEDASNGDEPESESTPSTRTSSTTPRALLA